MSNAKHESDWVEDSLRKLYTATLEEDIPDDMLSLLDQLDDAVRSDDNPNNTNDKERDQ